MDRLLVKLSISSTLPHRGTAVGCISLKGKNSTKPQTQSTSQLPLPLLNLILSRHGRESHHHPCSTSIASIPFHSFVSVYPRIGQNCTTTTGLHYKPTSASTTASLGLRIWDQYSTITQTPLDSRFTFCRGIGLVSAYSLKLQHCRRPLCIAGF